MDSTLMVRTTWNYLKSHLKLQTGIELVHDRENPFIVFQFKDEAHFYPEGWSIPMEYEISFAIAYAVAGSVIGAGVGALVFGLP